jgi:integrase
MPPKLEHVRYVRTRGTLYAYFNTGRKTRAGRPEYAPLPDPRSASFFQSYAAFKAAREQRAKPTETFAKLVKEYERSREHAALSEGTQKTYRSILKQAVDLLGEHPIDAVDRPTIQLILDRTEWGAGKRNLFVAVIGAVYKWGRGRGKTDAEPAKGIAVAETGEHAAWPEDVLDSALEDQGRAGLAVALLLYTGQRIGDVCKMRWDHIKGRSIKVTQQKTGKRLTIPLHASLRERLAQTPRTGMTILVAENGRPAPTATIRREVKALAGDGLKPHGLRKNAVIALLGAGCSVAEVAAITGQTYALVEYYARQIDQERMAEAAILRWEQSGDMQRSAQNAKKSQ